MRRVKGRVAASESIYDFDPAPGGWSWDDLGNYYGAGVYDINFNDNAYQIYMTGFGEGSPAVIDSVSELGRDIHITSYLTSSGNIRQRICLQRPILHMMHGYAGSVPADSSIILKASMPDPPGITGEASD